MVSVVVCALEIQGTESSSSANTNTLKGFGMARILSSFESRGKQDDGGDVPEKQGAWGDEAAPRPLFFDYSSEMHALKTLRELGPARSLAFLGYQAMKKSGLYRLWRPPRPVSPAPRVARPVFSRPPRLDDDDPARARVQSLLAGSVTLFGTVEAPLDFSSPGGPPVHWTEYDRGQIDGRDVKFIWEPARFGWACDLARICAAGGDDRLRDFLAETWMVFSRDNPPYRGPHWASGQEVALRLIHLVFADAALGGCLPDFDRVIAVHAARIPPTLLYARAQDNNHLLSEAAGLFTAGVVLPDHPQAGRWRRLGWKTFHRAVQSQFGPDGVYVQHSANYQRLALQLAVWTAALASQAGLAFPPESIARLAAGTRWLLKLCDPDTGRVPNLGANDGAQILPLSSCPYSDFRPALQAAARMFLGQATFDPGPWDETGTWLDAADAGPHPPVEVGGTSGLVRLDHPNLEACAFLRAAAFTGRPGHADQLHVDLWLGGVNLALDPGTFSYTAAPPWDNPLQTAHHHNTLTVDGRDQMTRAGRFRYVDRAQAVVLETGPRRAAAEHNGYRRLGLVHRRVLEAVPEGWRVTDTLRGPASRRRVRLHWLLPDWPWRLEDTRLIVDSPVGRFVLEIVPSDGFPAEIALARAGEALVGPSPAPTMGWYSPTYGVKEPALSFCVTIDGHMPVAIESSWRLRESGS